MPKRIVVSGGMLVIVLLLMLAALAGCGPQPANKKAAFNSEINQPVNQSTGTAKPGQPAAPGTIPGAEAGSTGTNNPTISTHVYQSGATGNKRVYLTFDDGPNNFFTPRILGILKQNGARATFMVVGTNVVKNPDVVQLILADGDGLANHTYSHDYKKIYRSPEAFIADLNRCSEAVQAITGQPVKVFRAPGGPENLKPAFWQAVKANGYYSVGWNVVGGDANPHGVTADQVYNNVVSGLDKVEKLHLTPIILLHDGTQLETMNAPPNSATGRYIASREAVISALPKIIELLKSRSYSFAIADQNTPAAW
ncbi:polysaccharide deacetylase family protein [Desulfotomaculum copahuensis]|nr:polysaccharide deacetylase family protein [Desulfotomaculum copahuensis]